MIKPLRLMGLGAVMLTSIATNAGLPMPTTTTLPAPASISEEDKELVAAVIALPVYKDSKDPNKYYYVPPFRVFQFKEGATSMQLLAMKADNVSKAEKIFTDFKKPERQNFEDDGEVKNWRRVLNNRVETLERLNIQIVRHEEKLADLNDRLLDARLDNDEAKIKLINSAIESKHSQILSTQKAMQGLDAEIAMLELRLKKTVDEINQRYAMDYCVRELRPVFTKLASAGRVVNPTKHENADHLLAEIDNTIKVLKRAYGGYFGVSIYSGFTRHELDSLTYFKSKYMPHLTVSLMAADELEFKAMTEMQNYNGNADETLMFRATNGSGGYHGANLIFDLTVEGAYALAHSLGPVNLPIGISAKIKQSVLPTKAKLHCDFTNGYTVKGRADVRDGLVIYDNDITNTMKTSNSSEGACSLELIEGDINSAYVRGIEELQKYYEERHLKQTVLTERESKRYYAGMLQDIENNRRPANSGASWIKWVPLAGQAVYAVQILSKASEFHWHTNIQDVSRIWNAKFTKNISVSGHEEVRRKLPSRLCMFFNPVKNAYDRCTEEQEKLAKTLGDAQRSAESSEQCNDSDSASDCGQKRAQSAPELFPTPDAPKEDDVLTGTL